MLKKLESNNIKQLTQINPFLTPPRSMNKKIKPTYPP